MWEDQVVLLPHNIHISGQVCHHFWYQSNSFLREESLSMEVGRGRGRGRAIWRVADEELCEEIRILSAQSAAVEAGRNKEPEDGDESEEETDAPVDDSINKGWK